MADTAAAGKELRNAAAAWFAEEPNKLLTVARVGDVFDTRGRARREEEAATLEVMAAADGVNGEAATLGKAAAEANGNGAATLGKVAAEVDGNEAATLGKAAAETEGAATLGKAAAEAEGADALGRAATKATGAATLGKAAAGDGTKGGSPLERAATTWEAATEAAEGKQRGWGAPAKTEAYGRCGEGRAIRGAPTLGGAKELGMKGGADAFKAAGTDEAAKGEATIALPEAANKGAGG